MHFFIIFKKLSLKQKKFFGWLETDVKVLDV